VPVAHRPVVDQRPCRVGLTGGLASGKSTVARCLETRGVAVCDADALVHQLDAPGAAGSRALFEQSQAAFANCIVQGENIPYHDEILAEQVIANCRSYNEIIQEALLSLQGEQ